MLVVVVSVTYDIVITAELTSLMFNIQCSPETTDCVKTLNWTFDSLLKFNIAAAWRPVAAKLD